MSAPDTELPAAAPPEGLVAVPSIAPPPAAAARPAAPRRNPWLAVFRPNAAVPASVFRLVIAAEVALLVAAWFLAPSVIPSPGAVAAALPLLLDQGLVGELYTSLVLNLQAIAWTLVISLLLAYASVLPVMRPVVAAVSKGRFLGMMGLTFVFTMYATGAHGLKLSMLVFGMTVFFVTSMADVVAGTSTERLDYARTLRMGEWQTVWEVIVLGNLDKAMEVLRQNAAIGWMMLTMVEGLARSEGGIGTMLLAQNKHFNLAAVFALQGVILAVGLTQDAILGWLRNVVAPHAALTVVKR
jgi:NitT/TauT family transport system permease protein